MRRFLTAIATLTALAGSGSASADPVCDDLWFSRNIVFHEAGYCFGSALGQTVFGNARCIGQDIDLHADMKARVEEIRQREADWGCAVDTSRTRLDLPQIAQRMALTD